jgi:hypothetical protein
MTKEVSHMPYEAQGDEMLTFMGRVANSVKMKPEDFAILESSLKNGGVLRRTLTKAMCSTGLKLDEVDEIRRTYN